MGGARAPRARPESTPPLKEPTLTTDDTGDGARLLDPSGRAERSPATLRAVEVALDAERLAAARRHAGAHGRVLERDGRALLSWGVAARLVLPLGLAAPETATAAEALLAAIAGDNGARALALGALPFDPHARGELVVPAITVIDRRGHAPVARAIGTPEEVARLLGGFPFAPGAPAPPAAAPADLPDRFELISSRSHAEFRALVAEAVAAIEAGELDKVVLAREVVVRANRPFQQADLLNRLRALHPSCLAFALDGFVGASPELLCRRRDRAVASEPLAGTVARSGDPEADEQLAASLFASPKERREHRLVVDAIAEALAPLCAELTIPEVPIVLELRNVAHLATPIRGHLAPGVDGLGALALAARLQPTPAVGGWPRAGALEYLAKHEGLERGPYAGPVGYVEAGGDGEFWLGIRSAQITGAEARLMAGVGIVAGSDPAAELAETQLKLQALLAVAVRP